MNVIINNKSYKVVSIREFFKFKNNDECIILKRKNSFNTFLQGNIDILVIDENNQVQYKYVNISWFKTINLDLEKEKTSILFLPKNASLGLKIGNILTFESKHII